MEPFTDLVQRRNAQTDRNVYETPSVHTEYAERRGIVHQMLETAEADFFSHVGQLSPLNEQSRLSEKPAVPKIS